MRRPTLIWAALGISAAAITLFATMYGVGSDRVPGTAKFSVDGREPALPTTEGASSSTILAATSGPVSANSSPTSARGLRDPEDASALGDKEVTQKLVRDYATNLVRGVYPLLLEDLELTPSEIDALLSLLIQQRIDGMSTQYSSPKPVDEQDRRNAIAEIIGESKLRQFLAKEDDIQAYWQMRNIESLLEQNDVPVTETQRDGLLEILVGNLDLYEQRPPKDVAPGSIEYLENRLAQKDEYQRLVLELAPSVLSPEQFGYLFEQYEYLSYQRGSALEAQKKPSPDSPTKDGTYWYPAWAPGLVESSDTQ